MSLMLHEKRLIATLIDAALIFIVTIILTIFAKFKFMPLSYFLLYTFTFSMMIYQFFTILILKNKTIGMFIMGTRVISSSWQHAGIKQIFLRSISISVPILFVVNIFYVFMNQDQKSIFEVISDTIIVDSRESFRIKQKKKMELN